MNLSPIMWRNIIRRLARFSLSAHRMRRESWGEVGSFFQLPLRFPCFLLFIFFVPAVFAAENLSVLKPASFAHYINRFNSMEDENVTNFISNAESWNWLQKEIPFFECPDKEVEEMY